MRKVIHLEFSFAYPHVPRFLEHWPHSASRGGERRCLASPKNNLPCASLRIWEHRILNPLNITVFAGSNPINKSIGVASDPPTGGHVSSGMLADEAEAPNAAAVFQPVCKTREAEAYGNSQAHQSSVLEHFPRPSSLLLKASFRQCDLQGRELICRKQTQGIFSSHPFSFDYRP
jgi:hypothetical protein